MTRAEEILQGCSKCNPRHPQTIYAVSELLGQPDPVKVTWYLSSIGDTSFDDIEFSIGDTSVAMPANLFNLATQLSLFRHASDAGNVGHDMPPVGDKTPTTCLTPNIGLIDKFFDRHDTAVLNAKAGQISDREFLIETASVLAGACNGAQRERAQRLQQIATRNQV